MDIVLRLVKTHGDDRATWGANRQAFHQTAVNLARQRHGMLDREAVAIETRANAPAVRETPALAEAASKDEMHADFTHSLLHGRPANEVT